MGSDDESVIRMAYLPEGRSLRVKVYSVPVWPPVWCVSMRGPLHISKNGGGGLLVRSVTFFRLFGSLPVMRVMVTGPSALFHLRVKGSPSVIW